ncbi:MAG TPA: hypothetical protein VIX14_01870 [Terriglobales bacterium]
MRRILLPLSLLSLVLFAAGLVLKIDSKNPASTSPVAATESSTPAIALVEKPRNAAKAQRAKSEHDAGEPDLPPALGRHIEKLARTTPGNGGEGPAASAAEWRFRKQAYPAKDISLAKIEGARAAHAARLAKGPAGTDATSVAATWVSLGPSSALYPQTPLRNSYSYVPASYLAGGRTTALAIDPGCIPGNCRLYAAPAGGGVWRTNDALKAQPVWTYVSGSFGINAVSSVKLDPNNSNIVWAGTGEANVSSDSEAGVGLYKSTDGGDTWTGPIGRDFFNARAIGSIAIDPTNSNNMYVATTIAVRGISSVEGGEDVLTPGAPPWGLYKSTDGGVTWSFIFNGAASTAGCRNTLNVIDDLTPCSPLGVRRVVLDPSNPNIVYASAYATGVWRSNDGGNTWSQIFLPIANPIATGFTERPEIAVAKLPSGHTRMYLTIGQVGAPPAQTFVSEDVATGTPNFFLRTSSNPASPLYGTFDSCTGQCWYDNFVYTPPGYPDIVYILGCYQYGETGNISNGRGVVLSTDGGHTFTDMTMDATDFLHPNGIHPDQHSMVTNPANPLQFIEGSDGGIMRSSGALADASANCSPRGLSGAALARCQQLLSQVPAELKSINKGLTTLQFYSVSISPFDSTLIQGGTQDNGTWQSTTTPGLFKQSMFGDGGQSGFDVVNASFRFHTYYDASPDVNFSNGATFDWNWIADPIYGTGEEFYVPIISDPSVSGTMFVGTATVYRTKTDGMGSMNLTQLRKHCNEFTGDFTVECGDWVTIGATSLTDPSLGTRAGGSVAAVQRTASDTSTLWAATSTGRVFISHNADTDPNTSVVFTRIDTTWSAAPNRFVSGIAIDPANSNHAWITYDGFSASTPSTPGHVFEVTYNPVSQTATFTDRSYDLNDLPITDVVLDSVTGDLYASSDFGVYRLKSSSTAWGLAAKGMPNAEISGLTIVPSARLLYAASHGLGVWVLNLP